MKPGGYGLGSKANCRLQEKHYTTYYSARLFRGSIRERTSSGPYLASCCVAVTAISGASLFTPTPAHARDYRQHGYYDYRSIRPIIMRAIPMLIITPIHLTLTRTAIGLAHIVAMSMPGFGWTGRYWW